jgi:hypothetical protein
LLYGYQWKNWLLVFYFSCRIYNGEFNYLRTQGRSRPISVIELIKIARQEARQTGKKLIMEYFKLDSEGK